LNHLTGKVNSAGRISLGFITHPRMNNRVYSKEFRLVYRLLCLARVCRNRVELSEVPARSKGKITFFALSKVNDSPRTERGADRLCTEQEIHSLLHGAKRDDGRIVKAHRVS